ncbi:hypothetical protein [Massilia sp. TS11]|uniref:hypothetical protein n=1 Tax=Massilia sp. TS11 TaxID=2908003 RepID=UPI001EDB6DD4|nr:hypothetical protein [Massilia sp. TS11]MCG2586546.1 hypothetical protein [Massilia sp. TS11]
MKTITYDDTKWKLVPVEPTPKMLDALNEPDEPNIIKALTKAYKACIAAAPSAPQAASAVLSMTPELRQALQDWGRATEGDEDADAALLEVLSGYVAAPDAAGKCGQGKWKRNLELIEHCANKIHSKLDNPAYFTNAPKDFPNGPIYDAAEAALSIVFMVKELQVTPPTDTGAAGKVDTDDAVAWCVENPDNKAQVFIYGNGAVLKPGDKLYLRATPPTDAQSVRDTDKDGNHADDLRVRLDELEAKHEAQDTAFQLCSLKLKDAEARIAELEAQAQSVRDAALEEAAKVCEEFDGELQGVVLAQDIRALKAMQNGLTFAQISKRNFDSLMNCVSTAEGWGAISYDRAEELRVALKTTAAPAAQAPAAQWRVGEFWSSSNPSEKVLVLAVGDEIAKHGAHHSFIRWVGAAPAGDARDASLTNYGSRDDARDAARYRFLRKGFGDFGPDVDLHNAFVDGDEKMDAAIDAAMKEKP